MKALLVVILMFVAGNVEAKKREVDLMLALGGPAILTTSQKLMLANVYAKEYFQTPLCRKAYRARFNLDPATEWFDDRYSISVVPGMLPVGGTARGATYCKASVDNMIVSEFWIGLGDIDDTAETIMHEFFHLLQCQNDPTLPEPNEAMHEEAMKKMEAEAYVVTAICMGVAPQLAIEKWGFTPKGFEKWDS
jgi:hypothetical protein